VGGQFVSSLVFTVERHPMHSWGMYGSFVMASSNTGTFIGGLVATALHRGLDEEQLISWGWRIPFLSGILVSLSGIYLRLYGDEPEIESGDEIDNQNDEEINPIVAALLPSNRRALCSSTFVVMLWSGGFFLSYVWMAIFMEALLDPPIENAFLINSASLLITNCCLFPLAGILSDWYGRSKIMYIGGFLLMALCPIMIYVIQLGHNFATFFAQSTIGLSLALWGAPMW